jgi:type 1 glutamine amidotransferase
VTRVLIFVLGGLLFGLTLLAEVGVAQPAGKKPHVVFVTGDEEYRSEESMPFLARILEKHHGFKVTICYALDPDGTINPQNLKNIAGLEALKDADLMVMYARYRQLPDDQLNLILDYANSGKPMVGFRTSTHAFKYDAKNPNAKWNDKFGREIFGQQWITHHGHHGHKHLTEIVVPEKSDHVLLRGVKTFNCYSWLYHVHGGKQKLYGDCAPILEGKSLISSHEKKQDVYPKTQPVAWLKTYTGTSNKAARVFFTTLGHPHDFESESMRRLACNGIFWALGREKQIPAEGLNVELLGKFNLTNAGFGKHVKGAKPADR